jgi:hypothetical protein
MSTGTALTARRSAVLLIAVFALVAALLPQSSARAQVADWVDIPVSVAIAAESSYFVVLSSQDGTIEALQGDTTRSFGYPTAGLCDERAGACFTSVVPGLGAIGFEGTGLEVRAALASLRFRVRDGVVLGDALIDVSVTANPDPDRSLFFNPTNGHYYEYVAGNVTWFAARTAAAGLTLTLGGTPYTGYLATITSQSEMDFIATFVNAQNVWFGASDDYRVLNEILDDIKRVTGDSSFPAFTGQYKATPTVGTDYMAEGEWYWVTGPEVGTRFFSGCVNRAAVPEIVGSAVGTNYNAWKTAAPGQAGAEPNNFNGGACNTTGLDETAAAIPADLNGEHYAVVNFGTTDPVSNWNDFPASITSGTGFLAEFGPIDPTVLVALATNVEFRIVDLIPAAAPVSMLAISCSPDPAVPGGTVTCQVTGGDPNIDILWRASLDGGFASQGVRLDADGNGTFTFVAPAGSAGRSITVELVDWNVSTAVGVVDRALPSAIRAGGGPLTASAALLLGSSLLLAALLASRLRVRRPSEG